MYKVNDYVMYKHDVCKVREIRKNGINGNEYYILIPISDETLIMSVPVENRLGFIRDIITKEDALKLINNIKNIEPLKELNDKVIENKYKELLNTYSRENLIKIIKTCYLRNKERIDTGKKIGEKDKSYFDKAEDYLYNELCVSLNKTREEIEKMIIEKCN